MAENEGGVDDPRELSGGGGPPKSPWKTAVAPSSAASVDASSSPAAAAVTDSDSWPALSDAQQLRQKNISIDSRSSSKSPPPPPPPPTPTPAAAAAAASAEVAADGAPSRSPVTVGLLDFELCFCFLV